MCVKKKLGEQRKARAESRQGANDGVGTTVHQKREGSDGGTCTGTLSGR